MQRVRTSPWRSGRWACSTFFGRRRRRPVVRQHGPASWRRSGRQTLGRRDGPAARVGRRPRGPAPVARPNVAAVGRAKPGSPGATAPGAERVGRIGNRGGTSWQAPASGRLLDTAAILRDRAFLGSTVRECAPSYCFLNSPKYVELVGAQFLRHGTGVFRTTIAAPDHPVMKGYRGFESWDETYVHTRHNGKNRTILEYRVEKDHKEPWTWVRTQGKGRVFYTAWGHDQRTWSNPG